MSATVHSSENRPLSAPVVPPESNPRPSGTNLGGVLRRIALLVLLVLAAVFIYLRVKSNKREAAQTEAKSARAANRPIPVTVAAVQSRTMPIYYSALGTVTAYNTVTIKSRVDGQLLSVNVREGQQVKQGQLLAQIDPRPYDAAVAQAEGQLAKDVASADYAKAEAGRYTALFQAGVVSKESEQTQTSNAGATAGTLSADRAAIQAAKVNTTYTRILSPINGVVGLRQVDAGNIVHAADTTGLLVVTQLQPIAVIFTLPEDQLPEVLRLVRSGRKLVAEAYDRSQATKLATGTLLTVDNEIDTTTGTVKAKAVFDNRDGALFPNQFVNIRLVLEERAGSLTIPASGLQSGSSGNFVYVVKPCPAAGCPKATDDVSDAEGPGKPAEPASANDPDAEPVQKGPKYYVDVRNVTVDLTEGSTVILKSGLQAGDQIVIDGQEKLKRLSKVQPRKNPGTPSVGGTGLSGTDGTGSGSGAGTPASVTRTDKGQPAHAPTSAPHDGLDTVRHGHQGSQGRVMDGSKP